MKLRPYKIDYEKRGNDFISEIELESGMGSKLGGTPDWIQGDESPKCKHCNEGMSFVAQIASMEHEATLNPHSIDALSGEQHYMFGDAGMIYIFHCFECCDVKAILQF